MKRIAMACLDAWVSLCLIGGLAFAAQTEIIIAVPPTPSSIPMILATQNMEDVTLQVFANHSQAHTLFLRDDISILLTGLSVGMNFFKNDMPVQLLNSYVSGVTYLITRDQRVTNFEALQGAALHIPFEGSPIEELTRYFVEAEGLSWKQDVQVVYTPFASSLELLKQGKAQAAALPEPLATVATQHEALFRSFSYQEKWQALTGEPGYPQVGAFAKKSWVVEHQDFIKELHQKLAAAIRLAQEQPEEAVALTRTYFKFPLPVLLQALRHTDFALQTSTELKTSVESYYHILGNPLDETFASFFYCDPQ